MSGDAGGSHPDRSVGVHLAGLHLVLERGLPPTRVPPLHQALADSAESWPRFEPPPSEGGRTVLDVALSVSADGSTIIGWSRGSEATRVPSPARGPPKVR